MIEFAEGKKVREKHRSFPASEWKNYNPEEDSPLWDWEHYEYEVKPEERKPREITLTIRGGMMVGVSRRSDLPDGTYIFREVLPSENTGKEEE